jgi:hypothetical protein
MRIYTGMVLARHIWQFTPLWCRCCLIERSLLFALTTCLSLDSATLLCCMQGCRSIAWWLKLVLRLIAV